jgi:hypothetical protein
MERSEFRIIIDPSPATKRNLIKVFSLRMAQIPST